MKLQLNKTAVIKSDSGGQDDFIFTAFSTKKYTFQTVGQIDTVMVVSEMAETENYYMSGVDDSGYDKNSKITLPLVKGRDYLVHLRVLYVCAWKAKWFDYRFLKFIKRLILRYTRLY